MDYYENAMEQSKAANILFQNSEYRTCVSLSCLAIELYLKSRLCLADGGAKYEFSHDIISMYNLLNNSFASRKDLLRIVRISRKYFTESRYASAGNEVYTKEFAQEFLSYVMDIKHYVDNECIAD